MTSLFLNGLEDNNQVIVKKLTSADIERRIGKVENTNGLNKSLIVDLETTGLDVHNDVVIEIALREIYYDKDYKLCGFGKSLNALQDPKRSLEPRITEITGLTDADLKGQSIDWTAVNALIKNCQYIIAHNAAFDYKFLKKEAKFQIDSVTWACSQSQIDWSTMGFKSKGLELLAVLHGFYYEGHRAQIDVDALGCLLHAGQYLKELFEMAAKPIVRVKAFGADFDSKEKLRDQRYYWNNTERCWWKDEPAEAIEDVKLWLKKDIYIQKNFDNCEFINLPSNSRFS